VQKLKGKVRLSLNSWTLNNQYAFLAIVTHYVTNDGQLGSFFTLGSQKTMISIFPFAKELLIDFRELIGEHGQGSVGDDGAICPHREGKSQFIDQ
jgi:hypothetical protein